MRSFKDMSVTVFLMMFALSVITLNAGYLQGDEPCMPPVLINQVAEDLQEHRAASMTTLAGAITDPEQLFDPHLVKVVTDAEGYAMYFSRAAIPWHRDEFLKGRAPLPASVAFRRHIGLYAYRAKFLRRYVAWSPPARKSSLKSPPKASKSAAATSPSPPSAT